MYYWQTPKMHIWKKAKVYSYVKFIFGLLPSQICTFVFIKIFLYKHKTFFTEPYNMNEYVQDSNTSSNSTNLFRASSPWISTKFLLFTRVGDILWPPSQCGCWSLLQEHLWLSPDHQHQLQPARGHHSQPCASEICRNFLKEYWSTFTWKVN